MEATQAPAEVNNADTDTNADEFVDDNPIRGMMGDMAKIVAAREAAENGESAPEESEAAPAEKPVDEPAADEEPAPAAEVAPPKADDKLELKHGRALHKIAELEGKYVGVKQERDELKGRVDKFLQQAKANPLKLIEELSGLDFPSIMQKAAEGAFDEERSSKLPPEIQAQLDELTNFRKEETTRREAEKQAAARTQDLSHVKTVIAEMDDLQFCNAFDDAAEEIVDAAYDDLKAGRKVDIHARAREIEKRARADGRTPPARPKSPQDPNFIHRASGLWNGGIAPLVPFAIRGVIWYQGETNDQRGHQYRKLFPALIRDWRRA